MLRRFNLKWCLFLLIATLAMGVSMAQNIPEWKRGPLGKDSDGNRIIYWQDFEDQATPYYGSPKQGQELIELWEKKDNVRPIGWTDSWENGTYQKSSNNVFIRWMVKAKGGKNQPRTSYGVKGNGRGLHLRYFAYDDKAFSSIILPAIDLRSKNVQSASLKFQFASPARTQCDKLVVKFRVEKFGLYGGWKELATYQEQNEEFVLKVISLDNAFKNFRRSDGVVEALGDKNLAKIELCFEGHTKLGGGLNIDDIMIVDVNDNPLKLGQYELQQLTNPVGQGTNLNEIARLSFDVAAGYGFYKLEQLQLPYTGTAISDVTSFSLYHTSTPYFSSLEANKFCDLVVDGNNIKLGTVTDDDAHRILPGSHHFWVVANLKNNATLKNKVTVKFPANALKLKFFRDTQSGPVAISSGDRSLPAEEQYDANRFCTIYACLMKDDFEGATTSDWNLSPSWKIGKPVRNIDNTTYKTAPTEAFSGEKVLATAQESQQEPGYIDGRYDDNMKFAQSPVKYARTGGINAEFHKDVRFKAKYCLNSKPDDKFRLVVVTDANPSEGIPVDIETVVWENTTRTVMSGWNTMNIDLSKAATRNKKFRFRFEFETKDDSDAESGLFLDDIQILGDLIKKDIGILKVETPKGFDLSTTTPLKVTVKNYGKEAITGGYKIKVTLNGVTTEHPFTGTLAIGATATHSITGLNLAPDPNLDISNEKQIIVEVVLNTDTDDDASNNRYATKFYSYPTYDIATGNANKRYPKKDRFDRLLHWYPEAAGVQYSSSWTETYVDAQAKFKDKPQYTSNVPYSYQVWTTGLPQCNLNEQSTLTGPIFNLEGSDKKEFIVGFIYERDPSNTPATFYFEYSQDGNTWHVLEQQSRWAENWYTTNAGWSLNNNLEKYHIAKIELPITTGKIQLRAHFKATMPFAGVTISGFEVREMRQDFQITGFTPNTTSNNCNAIGAQKLKIKVKNNGPVATTAVTNCPVTVRVYEYPDQISYNQVGGEIHALRPMGEHLFGLSIPALAVGAEQEIETDIVYPWDVSDWGYRVEATLTPQTADENTANNNYVGDVVSMEPYFSVIKDLVRAVHPSVATFYTEDYPKTVMIDMASIEKSHFNLTVNSWTATPHNAINSTQLSAEVKEDATIDLSYTAKSSYIGYRTLTCPKTLHFKVREKPDNLQNIVVKYADQTGKDGVTGCYKPAGEKLEVTTTSFSDVEKASVDVYINGQIQSGLAITPNPARMEKGTTTTFTITGVKLPKGYSQLEILPVSVNSDGTRANLSQPSNIYRENRIYRAEVPTDLTLYWRNSALATAITPIPANGTVNNYVGRVTLYVPSVPGATYQWYKGNVDVTTFNALAPMQGETRNELDLPDESATYAVKITYGACGTKESYLVHVRTDDLELVAFNGVAVSGVCAAQGKLPLLVDIRNNSRTEYTVGTKLRFKLKVTPKVSPIPSGVIPYNQEFEYVLTTPMAQQAVNTLEIITLTSNQYASGDNDFELEFLGIVSGANLVKDGNPDNNKLIKRVSVNPSPEVTINPNVIRQKFTASENYVITPTYAGASPAVRYEWASKDEEDHDYTAEAGDNPNFTINGAPKDSYRVTAYNAQGCASEATVKFIQTDLELSNIVSPSSACDLGLASNDYVDIAVTNTGSKNIRNTEAKVKVTISLNSVQLKQEDLDLPSQLREVGKAMNLRVSVNGLKEKLKASGPHNLKVTIALVNDEDIVASNNEQQVELKSYGNPEFTMQYDKKTALNSSPVATPIGEGGKVEYYSNGESTFRFVPSGSSSDVSYEWAFGPDNTLGSIVDILDEHETPLTGNSTNLPVEFTKTASKDKMGSGFYYLTMRTPEGCSTRKYFELVVIRQDIEVIGVQAPASACDFTGQQTVSVSVSNVGTKFIPRDTKVKVKVEFYNDPMWPDAAKKHTLEVEQAVETDWLVGSAITVPLTFNYKDATWKADGTAYYIKAHAEFAEQEQKELEFVTTNNDYKYEALTMTEPTQGSPNYEAKKKEYLAAVARSKCFFADWKDVTVEAIKVKDRRGSSSVPLLPTKTFEYESTATDGTDNYVLLDADQDDCSYEWTLGYGLVKVAVPPSTDPVPTNEKTLYTKGAGKFELRLQTAQNKLGMGQTLDKACKATFTGYLATTGDDITISGIIAPAKEACLENSEHSEIIFTMRSNKPIAVSPQANPEAAIKFSYKLTKDGSPTDLLGTHGDHEATLKDIITRFNPDFGAYDGNVEAKKDFRVNLSQLANVFIPRLTEAGNYKLEVSFTVNTTLATYDVTTTNKMEAVIAYLGEAQIDPSALGGLAQEFYTPSAVLKIDDQKMATDYDGYHDFQWTLPNGTTTQVSTSSAITVTDPGTYKLSFKDRAGCSGAKDIQVKFPGYLQFAIDAIVAPVEGCDILNTHPVVTFKVKNEGKEAYTIPAAGIPVQMKLWDATGNEPTTWDAALLHGKATPTTIAPGETKEVTSAETLSFTQSADNRWNLKLNLESSTDGSHAPALGIDHPVAEAQVTDNPVPAKPNLEAQARAYLESHGVPAPVDLLEIPRDIKFTFEANGNTAGETYVWTTPENYSGVKDASSLEFNTSGKYKVKVTSGKGCVAESDEVSLRYKVEYQLLPILQESLSSFCVKKGVSTSEYIVKVKVTVEKADELIPTGTILTFNYRVTNNGLLVDQATEHLTTTENLAAGKTLEYTFTKHIQMPKGTNKVELSTTFDYFGKTIEGTGSKELRYVEGPAITINPKYEDNKPVTLSPIVEGGTQPYTYNWNGVDGGNTFEAEGGSVTILVTDQNGCTDEATTDVFVYHTLTIDKKGEGDLKVQQYKADGVQFENQLLNDGDRIFRGRKLKITALPNVAKKAILEYMIVNDEKISVDKTGKEYIIEKVTGNVKLEVRFKSEGGTAVEDARLAEVVCVSPVATNLMILHTESVVAYEVLNANGVLVASGKNAEGIDQIVVDAKAMRSGMYIVRVYSDTGAVRNIKVVKE